MDDAAKREEAKCLDLVPDILEEAGHQVLITLEVGSRGLHWLWKAKESARSLQETY